MGKIPLPFGIVLAKICAFSLLLSSKIVIFAEKYECHDDERAQIPHWDTDL